MNSTLETPANVQTATITGKARKFNPNFRKEKYGLHRAYAAINPKTGGKVVDLRIYWPSETAYACIWISSATHHSSGSGRAGGYGYCKESAAADSAISGAGIVLSQSIHGAGTREVEKAVLAIATALGYPDAMLVVTHP